MGKPVAPFWAGVALCRVEAAADPDAPPRRIARPLAWTDAQASALAALAPGAGAVTLPGAAEGWIGRLAMRAEKAGLDAEPLAESLRRLLLAGQGAPGAPLWRGEAAAPRFVLRLSGFVTDAGFEAETYAAAVAVAVRAMEAAGGGKAPRLSVGFCDLAACLALLDLAYDSAEARAVAACLAALTRGAAEQESGRLAARFGAREPAALLWPAPPGACAVPGLAEAARDALDAAAAAPGLRHAGLFALAPADAAEALLGAATGGLAPPTGEPAPALLFAARHRLARPAPRISALFAPVPQAAREAMQAAIAPFLHAAPPEPLARPAPPRAAPLAAPRALHAAATIGGHRVALRVGLDEAGAALSLGFAVARDVAGLRALLDGIAAAVNAGLAQGVPLAAYVDAFAHGRLGPGGTVEGDPAIRVAASVPDWAFRHLAQALLARHLPDPPAEALPPAPPHEAPLLPLLDLPAAPRRLRLAV